MTLQSVTVQRLRRYCGTGREFAANASSVLGEVLSHPRSSLISSPLEDGLRIESPRRCCARIRLNTALQLNHSASSCTSERCRCFGTEDDGAWCWYWDGVLKSSLCRTVGFET